MCRGVLPTFSMSPVRMHFWQVVARAKPGSPRPMNSRLNWFIPAGVNSTVGSLGEQRVGGHHGVSGGLEVREEAAADLGGVHQFSFS